jgi:hypothetical protein
MEEQAMAEGFDPGEQPGESGEKSAGKQAKEKVTEASQQLQEKAVEARGQAGGRLREQVDARSTQAGEQVGSIADAIRRTGEQLRSEGKEAPAKVSDQAAERAERLGGYLRDADADRILGDVEALARRQPWLVGGGGLVLGFFASRFLKASSSRRYQSLAGEERSEFPTQLGASGEYGGEDAPLALPEKMGEPVGTGAARQQSRPTSPETPSVSSPGGAPGL